jgi:hypothetical protein
MPVHFRHIAGHERFELHNHMGVAAGVGYQIPGVAQMPIQIEATRHVEPLVGYFVRFDPRKVEDANFAVERRTAEYVPAMLTEQQLIRSQPSDNGFPLSKAFIFDLHDAPLLDRSDEVVVHRSFAGQERGSGWPDLDCPRRTPHALLQRRGKTSLDFYSGVMCRIIERQHLVAAELSRERDQREGFLLGELSRRNERTAGNKIPLGLGIKLQRHIGIAQCLQVAKDRASPDATGLGQARSVFAGAGLQHLQ